MSDPRIYYAAERTLLAWIRTGLAIIALGFVVSRFALFLRLVANPHPGALGVAGSRSMSDALGVGLVLIGSGIILVARYNRAALVRTLSPQDVPSSGILWLSSALALALSALGFIMAVYLVLR